MKTGQKMIFAVIIAAVLLAFTIILIVRNRKKSTTAVPFAPPVVTGSTGTGTGTSTGTGTGTPTPTLTITGVGQSVTGLTNPQTVTAPARVINLLATPAGTYSGSATLKNAAGAVLHTEPLNELNISSADGAYPAVYFNPRNSAWGISAPGTYTIEVTFNIAGTNCTASTTLTITANDLGQNPVNPPHDLPPASSVRTDLINVVKDSDTGLYSNEMPDVIGNYLGYFYENGIPYLNPDGSRRNYLDVSIRPGLIKEVSVVFLDSARYPTFAKWLSEGWKTMIRQEQIQINGSWVNATDTLKAANPTAPTRIIYPNENWLLGYGQHNFVTA